MKRLFALFLIFFYFITPVSAATDVKNDPNLSTSLISFWEHEQTTGNPAVDSHGSNDLTDNNTVGSATGIQGNGADFEAGNSEYFSITDAAQTGLDLGVSGVDWSMMFWYKPETHDNDYIFQKDDGQPNRSYGVSVGTNQFGVYNSSDGTNTNTTSLQLINHGGLSDGTWYCVAIVVDLSAGRWELYLNGQGVGTSTASGLKTTQYNSAAKITMGSFQASSNFTDGVLDEFGVWSKTLTGAEVSEYCNGSTGIPYDAGGAGESNPATSGLIIFGLLVPTRNGVKYSI